jgi:hypothetical protein
MVPGTGRRQGHMGRGDRAVNERQAAELENLLSLMYPDRDVTVTAQEGGGAEIVMAGPAGAGSYDVTDPPSALLNLLLTGKLSDVRGRRNANE